MNGLRQTVRKDTVVLLMYLALIATLVVSERTVNVAVVEKWTYVLGSLAYVVFISRNHWVSGEYGDVGTPTIRFIGIGLLFATGGLLLGVVIGVNLKFLLGSAI